MIHLEWEACYNVRDMGGYPTREGGCTRERALIRSDNLNRLTPSGQAALVEYGVRTIIDLRFPDETERFPDPFADPALHNHAIIYLNVPLRARSIAEAEARFQAAHSFRERYCLALDYTQAAFARVMNAIADAPEGPVLVHCHAGRDRTGLVVALLLALLGVPQEIIAEDYALSDQYIKPLNDEFIRNLQDQREREQFLHEMEITRPTMLAVLAYLKDKYGGAQAYLHVAGVSEENIDRIKRRLLVNCR